MAASRVQFPRMGHVALLVADLERSERFYREIFGMRLVWKSPGEIVFLETGDDDLALIQAAPGASRPPATATGLHHFGFRVRRREEVDAAAEQVRAAGVVVYDGPRDHRDGSRSFYVRDPDGHSIQVLWDPIRTVR
ncbi:MAG TPA: VOC family protein [Thermodesulfobacteriota bacterium]|nr:VOC family protein [Thermodesulfobacteriota bacterium]